MKETVVSRENQAQDLKQWFTQRGFKLVLADLDDTLIDTNRHFNDHYREYFDFVKRTLGFSAEEMDHLAHVFHELDIKIFFSHSVNPVRYLPLLKDLVETYEPEKREKLALGLNEGLPILIDIYRTVPAFHPGAEETLALLKATGVEMGLVTHGNLSWSNLKIRELRLRRFFDHFWIADEDGFKNGADWISAVKAFSGRRPSETMVIGDNVKGDIRAADEVGIRGKVLIPSNWSVYREGDVPQGTIVVPKINQLAEFLLNSTN